MYTKSLEVSEFQIYFTYILVGGFMSAQASCIAAVLQLCYGVIIQETVFCISHTLRWLFSLPCELNMCGTAVGWMAQAHAYCR
jgi:hypothetical protein